MTRVRYLTGTSHTSFTETAAAAPPGAPAVDPSADPFGAAPFDPEKIRKHLKKQESQKKRQQQQQQQAHNNNESNQEKKVTAIRIDALPPHIAAAATPGNDPYHTYL